MTARVMLEDPQPAPADAPQPAPPARADRLVVRHGGRIAIVRVDDIDWIASAGNDVTIHTRHGAIRVRQTLASIEDRLRGTPIVRIHRCRLINFDRVEQVWHSGESGTVLMRGGAELRFARSFRKALRRLLAGREGGSALVDADVPDVH